MNKVIIIIINYNRSKITIECLESLFLLTYKHYQIVVVDNNSQDASVKELNAWLYNKYDESERRNDNHDYGIKNIRLYYNIIKGKKIYNKSVTLIVNKNNFGFAAGNNIGIRYYANKYDYVWLLNNDTIAEKDSLLRLLNKMREAPYLGICGSKIINYYTGKIQSIGTKLNKYTGLLEIINDENKVNKIDSIQGASYFISKECIQSMGLLPEEYFLYFEESDYCLNALQNGFSTGVALDSIIYHKEGITTGGSTNYRKRNLFIDVLCLRNRLIFADKYLKIKIFMYSGMICSAIIRLLRGQPKVFLIIIKFVFVAGKGIDQLKQSFPIEKIKNMVNS
jgi:GT2 family glycosyltransferase